VRFLPTNILEQLIAAFHAATIGLVLDRDGNEDWPLTRTASLPQVAIGPFCLAEYVPQPTLTNSESGWWST
jgi:hypothetical protein